MRLITWNCCGKSVENSLRRLESYEADIIVLQECRQPIEEMTNSIWFGDNSQKGITVIVKPKYTVSALDIVPDVPRYFCPVSISGTQTFHLLAAWSKGEPTYVQAAKQAIENYREILRSAESVFIGDLNSNVRWNKKYQTFNHTALVKLLSDEFDMVSAYHEFFDEDQGEETRPTLFWRWKEKSPYHID